MVNPSELTKRDVIDYMQTNQPDAKIIYQIEPNATPSLEGVDIAIMGHENYEEEKAMRYGRRGAFGEVWGMKQICHALKEASPGVYIIACDCFGHPDDRNIDRIIHADDGEKIKKVLAERTDHSLMTRKTKGKNRKSRFFFREKVTARMEEKWLIAQLYSGDFIALDLDCGQEIPKSVKDYFYIMPYMDPTGYFLIRIDCLYDSLVGRLPDRQAIEFFRTKFLPEVRAAFTDLTPHQGNTKTGAVYIGIQGRTWYLQDVNGYSNIDELLALIALME